MPTVVRLGPYRLFFYSADRDEPPHIHVEREGSGAKFWIERLVAERTAFLLEAWHEYFGH